MSDWRPYEPCREHEEQARQEREDDAKVMAIAGAYGLLVPQRPISERAAALRQRIAEARKQ